MATTTVLAWLLIACYFVVERFLRKGTKALSLKAEECDRGSSRVMLVAGSLNILLVIFAPILNANKIGYWNIGYGRWVGVVLMLLGLGLRYWAAVTLGKFYTRTLSVTEGQTVIVRAPYGIIRHPGYAGISLMEIGAGLAVSNWSVLIVGVVLGMRSRIYWIQVEEQMLEASLQQYQTYRDKTWRLIPFVY